MASFNMDNLTMECFTNKKTYHKYLAKKDPSLFQKNEDFHIELRENHTALMELLSECILDPNFISQTKMRDSFNQLMIDCLDFIGSTKQQPVLRETHAKDDPDPEILFSDCKDLGIEPSNTIEYWKMQQVFKH